MISNKSKFLVKYQHLCCLLILGVAILLGCQKNTNLGKRTINWYLPNQFPLSQEDSLNIYSHLNKEMGISVKWFRFELPLNESSFDIDSIHVLILPAMEGIVWMDKSENPYVPIVLPAFNTQSYQYPGKFQIICSVPKENLVQNIVEVSLDTLYVIEPMNVLFTQFQRTMNRLSKHKDKPIRFIYIPNRETSNLDFESVGIVSKQYNSANALQNRKVIFQSKPIPDWVVLVSSDMTEEMQISFQTALLNVPIKHSLPYHIGKFVSSKMYDFDPLRYLIRNDTTFLLEK